MRPISRRRKQLLAGALACVALLITGSVVPAFGDLDASPARVFRLAEQAVRIAKRANTTSRHALAYSKKPGPVGPEGARGSEGLDGPQGADGPRGATGPAGTNGRDGTTGAQGSTGLAGEEGPAGPTGSAGAQGPRGYVRAFGAINPGLPSVVGSRSAGVLDVTRPSDDHYCIAVDAAIDVTTTSPVVAVDLGLSSGALGNLYASTDSSGGSCASGRIAVVTSGPSANAVGFTIVVP